MGNGDKPGSAGAMLTDDPLILSIYDNVAVHALVFLQTSMTWP